MKKLAAKLLDVMHECSYVQKNGKNQFHGYKYATSADVLEKVNQSFVKHGIISLAKPELFDLTDVTTLKGNIEKLATIQMTITLMDVETGETFEIVGIGSGQDAGDKAVMKAETAAIKYAYMLTLNISTGDDPEADVKTDVHTSIARPTEQSGPAEPPRRTVPIASKKRAQQVRCCADCGAAISDKVSDYSMKQYGRPLCMRCQQNERKAVG